MPLMKKSIYILVHFQIINRKKQDCCGDSTKPLSNKFIDRILRLAMEQNAFTLSEVLDETNTVLSAVILFKVFFFFS